LSCILIVFNYSAQEESFNSDLLGREIEPEEGSRKSRKRKAQDNPIKDESPQEIIEISSDDEDSM
jgi:hypothetical protein